MRYYLELRNTIMDMLNTWAQILARTVEQMWVDVAAIVPSLLVALVLLILGWIVGGGLAKIVAQLVVTLKIDAALRGAGVDKVFEKTGHSMNAGRLLGGLVKWFVIAIFLVAALEVLNLTQVTAFLSQIVFFYLPQVFVAVLILLIAAVLADFVQNMVVGAAKAADIGSPYFVGSVARWSIWVFAILAALDQLSVASGFIQTLFTGIVVSLSLALGLSFGLGGRDAAARYIDRVSSELGRKRHGNDQQNHHNHQNH
jgi:small-conductance mechanosensitive channel